MSASGLRSNEVGAATRGLLYPDEIAGVRKPLAEASPLPARIYVDPDVFAAEREHIFRGEWLPAGVAAQIPDPGDYFSVDIAEQPIVVLRNDAGTIRTFYRVCRHRSALIVEGKGNARTFQCPYHCWTYDLSGKLVSAPDMHKSTAFRKQDIQLMEVKTEIWNGIIMINFDPDAEALAPRLEELNERLAPWDVAGLEVMVERSFDCNFDWKLMLENAVEPYHVQGTQSGFVRACHAVGRLLGGGRSRWQALQRLSPPVFHPAYPGWWPSGHRGRGVAGGAAVLGLRGSPVRFRVAVPGYVVFSHRHHFQHHPAAGTGRLQFHLALSSAPRGKRATRL